jgi:hypothetical protein
MATDPICGHVELKKTSRSVIPRTKQSFLSIAIVWRFTKNNRRHKWYRRAVQCNHGST